MNQDTILEEKAQQIYNKIEKTEFTLVTALTILSVLIQLYKLYKSCNVVEDRTKLFRRPNLLQRTIIKRLVYRSIPDEAVAKQVYKEILNTNQNLSNQEFNTLV